MTDTRDTRDTAAAPTAARDRLARFAAGERMQDVWAGHYVPDMIRADLQLVLPAKAAKARRRRPTRRAATIPMGGQHG